MRLYRFSDVVGNITSVGLIRKSLERKSFKNFTIFTGLPGTGKSTCAEIAGLQLTCDNPVGGEPCLVCRNCKSNYNALQKTGIGVNLIKKNLGLFNSKKDMQELIKEIFVLESPIGNSVYILEEIHALDDIAQTALLEEIDRLPKNVYVIVCTTKPYKLLGELRSRALEFNFNRLTATESKLLFDKTCHRLGYGQSDKETEGMIINKSRGIPRDMVKLIEFIGSTNPSTREVADFLGFINSEDFTNLLNMTTIGLKETVEVIDDLLQRYTYDLVIDQLKAYVSDVMFYVTGGIQGNLTKKDVKTLKQIMTKQKVFKICKVLEPMSARTSTEVDLKMAVVKIAQLMKDKEVLDVIRNNSRDSAEQKMKARNLNTTSKKLNIEGTNTLAKMSQADLENALK